MYGFIWPQTAAQDSDDNFRCHGCNAQVLMASPREQRSLECKQQSEIRLCSTCLINRKPVSVTIELNI
ncbi:hypothetical protein [Bradyrhizobium sp. Tv2a-2]|uniref:hypothetical protein n=1 Tax=Bradyrhizobium sp. Tv2a-2 TaxID=113395 RepID=UPI00041F0792|nr:hypothetical protein [Bradyrhizobium sp. Tv2a-2]